jgi:hypothetical protein
VVSMPLLLIMYNHIYTNRCIMVISIIVKHIRIPHGSGTMEYITVFDGTLTLILADEQFIIKENESIYKTKASIPHFSGVDAFIVNNV